MPNTTTRTKTKHSQCPGGINCRACKPRNAGMKHWVKKKNSRALRRQAKLIEQ